MLEKNKILQEIDDAIKEESTSPKNIELLKKDFGKKILILKKF